MFSAYEYYTYDLLFNPYRFFQYFVDLDVLVPPPREPVDLVGMSVCLSSIPYNNYVFYL